MLDLHRLRLLRELDRRHTITAVAAAFSFSPSAVSQQLATLEREAGVQLLEPVGRRVRLTAAAKVLVDHADLMLEQMERAEAALARTTTELDGTLRVAAFQTAVLTLVPPALTRLAGLHPLLRVEVAELEPESALPAMVAGDFDLVLAEEYPGQPLPRLREIERRDILADELTMVTPDGWYARSLNDVAERPFVLEPPTSTAGQWALAVCRDAGFEPDVRYVSTDLSIHVRLVHEGLAAALLPDLAGARSAPSVRATRLRQRPARTIFTAVRRGAAEHPALTAVVKALVQVAPDRTTLPMPGLEVGRPSS